MKFAGAILLIVVMAIICLPPVGRAAEKIYRLGVPKGYNSTPTYQILFDHLKKRGLTIGKNLEIVPIDLKDSHIEAGKKKTAREIAENCNLFFTTGNYLKILFKLEIKSPLLFISIASPEGQIPAAMQDNTTGLYRGTEADTFSQSARLLPMARRHKLGLIYSRASRLETRITAYLKTCQQLGIELLPKIYENRQDIERVMREFKAAGVGGLLLFPPAALPEDLPELIKWQNDLKMPIIGQTRQAIEQGLLGGPVMNYQVLGPALADYAARILRGRNPSQLPVLYHSADLVINLAIASHLEINIPGEITRRAEIIGLAAEKSAPQGPKTPLKEGDFTIGVPKPKPSSLKAILEELALRGYVEGRNLHLEQIDFKVQGNPEKLKQIYNRITDKTDLLYITGNVLPNLSGLPPLKVPACFLATRETAALIPKRHRNNLTGVIHASWHSIFKKSSKIMSNTARIGMLAHRDSNIEQLITEYRKIARDSGLTLAFETYSRPEDIPKAMKKLQATSDVAILFSANVSQKELAEVVKWQNKLKIPVLSKMEGHARAGLLGGPVLNTAKLAPKLAEYIDKLLQGRSPDQLPRFYYPEKIVINLRTAKRLQLDIPAEIISQAEIIY